jgi:hypothetical protein
MSYVIHFVNAGPGSAPKVHMFMYCSSTSQRNVLSGPLPEREERDTTAD